MMERRTEFTLFYQGSKHYRNGYWQVNAGPTILIGRPCRDYQRAKARANNFVDSGRAAKRLKDLRS